MCGEMNVYNSRPSFLIFLHYSFSIFAISQNPNGYKDVSEMNLFRITRDVEDKNDRKVGQCAEGLEEALVTTADKHNDSTQQASRNALSGDYYILDQNST